MMGIAHHNCLWQIRLKITLKHEKYCVVEKQCAEEDNICRGRNDSLKNSWLKDDAVPAKQLSHDSEMTAAAVERGKKLEGKAVQSMINMLTSEWEET